jgi:hypothetical protein
VTGPRRRGRPTFVCGPPDSACYVYGEKVADEHLYQGRGSRSPHDHGEGPLCLRCGVPKGTIDFERASDLHVAEKGHALGTGACLEECGDA